MLSLLSYDFMQRAFLAVIAMSLFSPVLGTFLILRRQSLMSDTLSHVSLSGVAVSLIVMSKGKSSSSMSLDQYLFGSIVTISQEQVIFLFVIAAVVLLLTFLFLRPMYILTFDEDTAFVDGLPVRTMSILFNMVTGVAIALMIPAAGALLVSTIMVLPASIALRLGKNFKSVMLLASAIGFLGMVAGLYISYYAETPASASITIIFVAVFLLVSLLKRFIK